MDALLESLEGYCTDMLESINDDLKEKGKFVCSEQIDDVKDLVHCIKDIHAIKATVKKTV